MNLSLHLTVTLVSHNKYRLIEAGSGIRSMYQRYFYDELRPLITKWLHLIVLLRAHLNFCNVIYQTQVEHTKSLLTFTFAC